MSVPRATATACVVRRVNNETEKKISKYQTPLRNSRKDASVLPGCARHVWHMASPRPSATISGLHLRSCIHLCCDLARGEERGGGHFYTAGPRRAGLLSRAGLPVARLVISPRARCAPRAPCRGAVPRRAPAGLGRRSLPQALSSRGARSARRHRRRPRSSHKQRLSSRGRGG